MTTLTQADLSALVEWDTPTICNALEIVAPERRATGFTTRHLHCPFPQLKPIVGYARTAMIRAKHVPTRDKAVMRAQRTAYYEYVAAGPQPTVSVIQDLDGPDAGFGAFWGEVQTNIHKGLGCLGLVTDGCIRDLDMIAPGFQMLAGSYAPSHAHVHLVDFGGQVQVAGMIVSSDDIIHADRHGAVVVPAAVVRDIPKAIDLLTRREKVILDAAKAPGFDIAKLKKAMGEADEIH
ncbi:MAG: RraA family protein [Alphaproteobacteria bacterium]|nr:RraA family protein [Alphaproteobacteria bacterium]